MKLFTILVAVSWFTFVLSNSMSQDSPSGNQDEGGGRVRGAPGRSERWTSLLAVSLTV